MRRHWSIGLLGIVVLSLLLSACASKSSRFYTLNPVVHGPAAPGTPSPSSAFPSAIGIVSVEIPDYLDRPQIVTRNMKNGLEIAEFDRWAGELQKDIARVLAETMSAELPENEVFVLTGRRAIPADYRVTVNMSRFDPMPNNEVWLKALWTVLGKEGQNIAIRGEASLNEPIKGTGYDATVAAMSRVVDRLGTEIATAMKPVLAREQNKPQG